MAILQVPVRMRTYDLNPQGSATALATMSQDNPFDRRVIAKVRDLRGIDLGDAAPGTTDAPVITSTTPVTVAQATALPTANAAPSFMDSVLSALKGAAATVLPTMAAVALRPVGDSGPVPGTNPIQVPAPVSTTPKWLIPAGIGAAALVVFLVLRKK